MIGVPMRPDGPDVDVCAELVARDPSIKGMWLVPTYSNPTGATVSDEVARALLTMPAADDFRIWDNAYAVHARRGTAGTAADRRTGTGVRPPRPCVCARLHVENHFRRCGRRVPRIVENQPRLVPQAPVGQDDQARQGQPSAAPAHAADADAVRTHMARHRDILAPKFQLVLDILDDRLSSSKIASWTRPEGGYFISVDVLDGTASRTVALARTPVSR